MKDVTAVTKLILYNIQNVQCTTYKTNNVIKEIKKDTKKDYLAFFVLPNILSVITLQTHMFYILIS